MTEVVRDAKLFEAGNYPDRKLNVSESDLDKIIAGTVSCPIKIEHMQTPFDGALGVVRCLYRKGKELYGKMHFSPAAWELVKSANAKRLSVHIAGTLDRLLEVSLVVNPRVADAAVFGDLTPSLSSDSMLASELLFSFDLSINEGVIVPFKSPVCYDTNDQNEGGGAKPMGEQDLNAVIAAAEERGKAAGRAEAETQFSEREKGYTRTIADLKRDDAKSAASVKLAAWKSEGKLPPACEKYAEAILIDGAAEVTFADGGHMSAAEALVQFMTHLPKCVEIPGTKAENDENKPEYSDDEKAMFAELGVSVEEVEAVESGKDGE